ncbi:MAG: ThuA domain-containing protein, partial [Polyangiales bacterium]
STAPPLRVLVYSRTEGYRHASIADGVRALEQLAAERGWRLTHTEDAAAFVASLDEADVTVWLNTTGDVLSDAQQDAFEDFARAGGGWVGVHSAADTEYDWPWYGEHAGTWFDRHPRVQQAVVEVEARDHPATAHLDATWTRRDEWYDFRDNPRDRVQVLMSVRESSYEGGMMGDDHPIAWHHEHDGGRAFYTAMGHTRASYDEPAFRRHLAGGIEWAGGRE